MGIVNGGFEIRIVHGFLNPSAIELDWTRRGVDRFLFVVAVLALDRRHVRLLNLDG